MFRDNWRVACARPSRERIWKNITITSAGTNRESQSRSQFGPENDGLEVKIERERSAK
jgi:hypothetical protein